MEVILQSGTYKSEKPLWNKYLFLGCTKKAIVTVVYFILRRKNQFGQRYPINAVATVSKSKIRLKVVIDREFPSLLGSSPCNLYMLSHIFSGICPSSFPFSHYLTFLLDPYFASALLMLLNSFKDFNFVFKSNICIYAFTSYFLNYH